HREKEGSFFTVKEIWSPVQVRASGEPASGQDAGQGAPTLSDAAHLAESGLDLPGASAENPSLPSAYREQARREVLPQHFGGSFRVENRYSFISLDQCSSVWSLGRFPAPGDGDSGHETIAGGEIPGPAVAPGGEGELELPLPADWAEADVLY